MQVSIATTNAKSFTPLSPPLSPDSKIGIMKPEESSIYSSHQSPIQVTKSSSSSSSSSSSPSSSSSSSSSLAPMNEPSARPKNKFRMRICDAPAELLEFIKRSEEKSEKPLPSKSSSIINASVLSNVVKGVSTTPVKSNDSSLRKPGSVDEKRHRIRKNPYPRKAPSKSSPGITLRVDVYTTLKEDPKALLQRNEPSTTTYPTSMTNGFISSFTDGSSSGAESSPPHSPISHRSSPKSQISKTKTKTKRSKPVISERKRKGNSLARVMADRGLLESTLTPIVVSGEIKPIRIPPPPPMQFEELMSNIEQLNLDFTLLNRTSPKINWKGQPLSISHLPHYDSLHQKEAHVASTLRLTPVQYLTAKHTLISSARRYAQKSLPFRKSDAQKLLRIDVNKASKLWEFFMQVKWI